MTRLQRHAVAGGTVSGEATPREPLSTPEALADDDLDDLREHFVNGSGAYTDSALVGRLVREIDRLRSQPSAPERPDPGWFLDDEGNADQLLPALASAYHHSRHVKPSRLPDHSASWRDCSEGMCRRAQAALRAEQVERPSLDVADVVDPMWEAATEMVDAILDRPFADPDDELAKLARAFLRRDWSGAASPAERTDA